MSKTARLLEMMSAVIESTNMSNKMLNKFSVLLLQLLGLNASRVLKDLRLIDKIQASVTALGSLAWPLGSPDIVAANIFSTTPFRMVLATSMEALTVRFRHHIDNFPRYVIQFSFSKAFCKERPHHINGYDR